MFAKDEYIFNDIKNKQSNRKKDVNESYQILKNLSDNEIDWTSDFLDEIF